MVCARGSVEPVRVLIVEDDPTVRRLTAAALVSNQNPQIRVREAASLIDGIALVREEAFAAAIVSLDGASEISECIASLREAGLTGPIIATSQKGSVALAIEAMRAGAADLLVKPYHAAELARRLMNAMHLEATRELPVSSISIEPREFGGFEGFIGASAAMQSIYEQIKRISPSKAPVFVTGESGTGKEVAAEAIHARSDCASGPFIALNCSAIPKELMESEIFGHVKGAFTGAHEDRAGAAELAHGGTLFLDEICEMDLALQAKLLRFVQTGSVRRVGDTKTKNVNVRFVCATNREPMREVEAGRFREDLYYRLHVLPLHLPPLRDRLGDIARLAEAFLARYADEEGRAFQGFAQDAIAKIEEFSWPGNVRQLQNVIRRVVVLHDGVEVFGEMLSLPDGSSPATHEPSRDTGPLPQIDSPSIAPFWRQEQKIIEDALKAFGGNAQKAAAALEVAPSTIYRKLQSWTRGRPA
jgi:two-component system, repressor protein LuxO